MMYLYKLWTHLEGYEVENGETTDRKSMVEIETVSPEAAIQEYVLDKGIEMVKYGIPEVYVDGHGIYIFSPEVHANRVQKKRSE